MKRLTIVLFLMGGQLCSWLPAHAYDPNNRAEYLAKLSEAKAYYKDKCEKVAGIKIYKTVPDVEGLLLMKIRPMRGNRELADPNWPGAAFGKEAYGDDYITSFLGNETRDIKDGLMSSDRGYIGIKYPRNPDSLSGYRWVETVDPADDQRYRYSLEYKEVTRTSGRLIGGDGKPFTLKENVLERKLAPKTLPRYGVTFEDHVTPEERALWVASSTVKVLNLKTSEVLGEMTVYAISYIHVPRYSMPWLNHYTCGAPKGTSGQDTRHFVDQVLIPGKGK